MESPLSPHLTYRGQSPLARGLRPCARRRRRRPRIIPARAGFTPPPTHSRARPADHPRSRGVYFRVRHLDAREGGSSPLARGLRGRGAFQEPKHRIIPARAGFTRPPRRSSCPPADHPRSRGVYDEEAAGQPDYWGSSPLARGLRPQGRLDRLHGGIIPARAGFTRTARRSHRPWWDHPRSRGVYPSLRRPLRRPWGSSPLARGLRPVLAQVRAYLGIIPARAGFTASERGR